MVYCAHLRAGHVYLFGEKVHTENKYIRYKLIESINKLKSRGITPEILRTRANKLFPHYDAILSQYGVPLDFKYLSVIESNLDVNATSPVGAKGLWQFMPTTAREMGMTVNSTYDERQNTTLSTKNACIYLIRNKKQLGSWLLSAASYNCGLGCIKKNVRKSKTTNYFELQLNKETSDYVYRILAAKMLFEQYMGKTNNESTSRELKAIEGEKINQLPSMPIEIKVDSITQISPGIIEVKKDEIKLKEIGEITLKNIFEKTLDSKEKTIKLKVMSNPFINHTHLVLDIEIDPSQYRVYISKMLLELGKDYEDKIIKIIDKDSELGMSLPDLVYNNQIILEPNFKFKAKIYQYE
jgi:hypothetical protein